MSFPDGAVWVVVPTYDELENLPSLLDKIWASCPLATVLVVDDGSPDGTAENVKRRKCTEPRLQLLTRSAKCGLGGAYVAGFRIALNAGAAVIVQMDALLSVPSKP